MTPASCALDHDADAVVRWVHRPSGRRTPLCASHLRRWLAIAAEREPVRPVELEPLRVDVDPEREERRVNDRGTLPPVEPPADQRAAALQLRSLFVALVDAGFTDREALTLVAHVVTGVAHRPSTRDE